MLQICDTHAANFCNSSSIYIVKENLFLNRIECHSGLLLLLVRVPFPLCFSLPFRLDRCEPNQIYLMFDDGNFVPFFAKGKEKRIRLVL